MKIAAIGDIHSAAGHLQAALSDARKAGFDQLVVLGDLWTYGPEPVRTLDLVADAIVRDHAVLITGNHDQIYLDAAPATADYVSALPDWIAESVHWTRRQLESARLDRLANWQAQWMHADLLFSHANPYRAGDWSYLSRDDQFEAACDVLAELGFAWGVFGHTHRARQHRGASGSTAVTIGSIGQPRGGSTRGQWAMLEYGEFGLVVDNRVVALDWDEHCRMIDTTSLSEPTKQRLKDFYRR